MTRTDSTGSGRRRLVLASVAMTAGLMLALVPLPQMTWSAVAGLDTVLPVAADVSAEELPVDAPEGTSVVQTADISSFDMVGLRLGAETDEHVYVRVADEAGAWGEWMATELPEVDDAPDIGSAEAAAASDAVLTEPIWVGTATAVQVASSSEVVSDVAVLVVRQELHREAAVVEEPAGAIDQSGPAIIPRSSWGARASTGTSVAPSIELAVVHHTASASSYGEGDVAGILRSIQAYHMDGNGWSDIAYNFLVDRFGRIWEGREGGTTRNVIGAHAMGFNTGSFGVSMIGSYDSSAPSQASVDAVGTLIGWRMYLADRDPSTRTTFVSKGSTSIPAGVAVDLPRVIGHRDVGSTTCPGMYLYSRLDEIRNRATGIYNELATHDPKGAVPNLSVTTGRIGVGGWAIDPDTGGPIDVVATVDGQPAGITSVSQTASAPWPGLGWYFPLHGDNHGFTVYLPSTTGRKNVCVYAKNVGPGRDKQIFCGVFNVNDGTPEGGLTSWAGYAGKVTVTGKVVDPDAPGPVSVTVQMSGQPGGVVTQTVSANSAFGATFDAVPGAHDVCAYAANTNAGSAKTLGCVRVDVPTGSPFGTGEPAGNPPGKVTLSGWAIDPDTIGPIEVIVRLDGQPGGTQQVRTVANGTWPGLNNGFPGYGNQHRFAVEMKSVKGVHNLCAYGVNQGPGGDVALSCQQINVVK